MKKYLVLLSIGYVMFFSGVAHADRRAIYVPVTQTGLPADPNYAGAKYASATTTTETLVTSTSAVVMGVYLSSGASSSSFQIYDSSAISVGPQNIVYALAYSSSSSTGLGSVQQARNLIPFSTRFVKGITIKQTSVGLGENAVLLYMEQKAGGLGGY